MSPKEGVFYAGVMAGLILGAVTARFLGLHQLIGLGIGVFGGAGLGYLLQQAFFPTKSDRD
jgi:hypothetical protein